MKTYALMTGHYELWIPTKDTAVSANEIVDRYLNGSETGIDPKCLGIFDETDLDYALAYLDITPLSGPKEFKASNGKHYITGDCAWVEERTYVQIDDGEWEPDNYGDIIRSKADPYEPKEE